MFTRPESNEALTSADLQDALTQRMLPGVNADRADRERAWAEWQAGGGENILARYVRAHNNSAEADEDIVQEVLLTAYLGVERERYQPRSNVPFIAYVVGIARNKIREARRRGRYQVDLDEDREELGLPGTLIQQRQTERVIEKREQFEQLWSGIARLPEARRQVLEYYLSGASTGEIAEQLAISEALVRQHKCRGLRALSQVLSSQPGQLGRAA